MFKKIIMIDNYFSFKSIVLTAISFFISTFFYGQNSFHVGYGGASMDKCNSIYYDGNNLVLIAGETASFDTNEKAILLIKTDTNGVVAWSKVYEYKYYQIPNAIIRSQDGGFLIVGEMYPKSGPAELGFMMKIDINGEFIWERTYDNGGNMAEALSAKSTKEGGVVFVGRAEETLASTQSFFPMNSEKRFMYVVKTDDGGNVLWSKKYSSGNETRLSRANDVLSLKDGGYIVVGEFNKRERPHDLDIAIVRLSDSGEVTSAFRFGGDLADAATNVVQALDGSYYVAGETLSYGARGSDIILMKFNIKDELLWTRLIGRAGSDKIGSMQISKNNSLVIVGNTTDPETLDTDMLLLKINNDGKLIWSKSYGGNGLDVGAGIIETENSFYISGNIMSHKKGNMDISFVKTDLKGSTECSLVLKGVISKEANQKSIDVRDKISTEKILEVSSQEGQNIDLNVKIVKIKKVLTCN
jgi:hypothetical protein